jgi:hypothetical protein
MAATLELFDGVNTLDLKGSTYTALLESGVSMPRPPATPAISANQLASISFQPRTVAMRVKIKGTTQADLTTQVRALERMVALAQTRQLIGESSTKVVLKYQLGDTNADDVSLTVISGGFSADPSSFENIRVSSAFEITGTLTLVCEPFGKLADVTVTDAVIYNEQDGANLNYMDIGTSLDVWGTFIDFDGVTSRVDVPAHAETHNIWVGGGTIKFRFRDDPTGKANAYFMSKFDSLHNNGWAIVRGGAASTNIGNLLFTCTFSNYGQWQITNLYDPTRPDPDHSFKGDYAWYWIEIEYNSSAASNNPTFKITPDSTGVTTTYTVGDGLNRDTLPSGTVDDDSGNPIVIADSSKRTQTLSGGIDEIRIYEAASISDSLTAGLGGSETDLAAYFRFNEGGGTTLGSLGSMGGGAVGTITFGDDGIWSDSMTAIDGNAGGLLQVRIEDHASDPWVGAKTTYIASRSGERRFDNLWDAVPNAATHVDADILAGTETSAGGTTGGPTTNASGGTSAYFRTTATATSALQTGFLIRGYFDFQFSPIPKGLFRVLARCQVKSTAADSDISSDAIFGFALGYSFGGVTSTPIEADRVASQPFNQFNLLDLGEISIPPVAIPEGFTVPTLSIRVNACLNKTGSDNMANTEYLEWSCDHIFLLPIDEGSVIVDSTSTSHEVLADLISDPPGVWLLNTSSVPQSVADFHGAPIRLSPEAQRIYWMRDDSDDPSATKAVMYLKFTPLVSGL